jgi:DNA-binding NarL/FixJ family response regulator
MPPKRILIIEDHTLFRAGLRMALSAIEGIEIDEVPSVEQALLTKTVPALVVQDIQLHGINGLDGIAHIQRKWPQAKVVFLSASNSPLDIRTALDKGAVAFLSKGDSSDTIVAVINQILLGEEDAYSLPAASHSALPAAIPKLTARQHEVLELLNQGLSNKLIARQLCLSEHTIRWHVQSLLSLLQVSSRSEAAFSARKLGLAD